MDYITCLYINKEPSFTWTIDNSVQLTTPLDRLYGHSFEQAELEGLLNPDVRRLCIDICRTVELLESTTGKSTNKMIQDYYRYKRTTMGIQLGYIHSKFHGQSSINECVSLTLNLIVLKLFYMHVLDESRNDLCVKLRLAVDLTGIEALQRDHIDILVWILFSAAALAPESSREKGWFLERLKTVLPTDLASATDPHYFESYLKEYLKNVLQSHIWSSKLLATVFDSTCDLLAQDAELLMQCSLM